MEAISWSGLFKRRQEVHARFPSVFRLPGVRRALRLAHPFLRPGIRILEVGAGDEQRGARLSSTVEGAVCVSVDPDPAGDHDYRSIEEVEDAWDLVLLLEVIEHLPLGEGLTLLHEIHRRLAPGGVLVASTPNIYCPGRFLRDASHVTPYAWDELGGALLLAGFGFPTLYRVVPGSLLRRTGKSIIGVLGRGLGIDHAPSIAAVARRGPSETA